MCNRVQVLVKRSPTLGTLVSTTTKRINPVFIGKITLVPVVFLMALSILSLKRRRLKSCDITGCTSQKVLSEGVQLNSDNVFFFFFFSLVIQLMRGEMILKTLKADHH